MAAWKCGLAPGRASRSSFDEAGFWLPFVHRLRLRPSRLPERCRSDPRTVLRDVPQPHKGSGGLAITARKALLDKRAIVPGQPEASLLYKLAVMPAGRAG